ncbi:tRNA (guanine(37)-N1)-methyltransferase [Lachnellula suecica]|uniref:tRNA (Guanine(37)-N1)-methyltransferase n=1 Tax=Lachnellula suecica TaxID=602035 RepID=A0A8T9C232_9HELO|nr:tRNA (guanine(37)-N1)-methyltransferase [Lachnellula suecica]
MAEENLVANFDAMSLFRPPIVRSATAALDRSLFSKTIPIAAARVLDVKKVSQLRTQLGKSNELLRLERFQGVQLDPDPARASKGGKCLLLQPEVKAENPTTWSQTMQEAIQREDISVIPYDLKLDYDYWQYRTYVDEFDTWRLSSDRTS